MSPTDDSVIRFHKDPGMVSDWSNIAERTYDLLAVLEFCASEEMGYGPRARAKIRELHDWIDATGCGDELLFGDDESPAVGRPEVTAALRRMPLWARLYALEHACKDDFAAAHRREFESDGRKGLLSKWRRTMTRLKSLAEEIKAVGSAEASNT